MAVEILNVALSSNIKDLFHGFELFEPKAGDTVSSNNVRLDGWALSKVSAVRQLLLMNGQQIGRLCP